jgi:hypothetical protein
MERIRALCEAQYPSVWSLILYNGSIGWPLCVAWKRILTPVFDLVSNYASRSHLIKAQGLGHYQGKGRDVGFSASRGRRVLRQTLSTQRTLAWDGYVDLLITVSS